MIRILVLILLCKIGHSQQIENVRSYYTDDISVWEFFQNKENVGSLRARWAHEKNYSEWDIRVGEFSGFIKLRWKERPNEWDLRLGNELITINPVWIEFVDKWRIEWNGKTYALVLKEDFEGMSWILQRDDKELLIFYNEYKNDFRDWVAEIFPDSTVELPLQLAVFFVATYYSTPK